MKEQRTEELFELLSEIDSTLPEQAYAVDSAEKLKSLCDAEAEARGKRVVLRPVYRRAAVICASLVLVAGLVLGALGLPTLLKNSGNLENFPMLSPDEPSLPPVSGWDDIFANATGEILINNLDKLNYYAARWLMDAEWGDVMQQGAPLLIPLTLNEGNVGYDNGYDVDTPPTEDVPSYPQPPAENQSPALGDQQPSQGSGSSVGGEYWVGDRVVYYALEPNDRYTIDAVAHFQIELADPQGFLASRVGTGIVDVVITSNNLEPMITFRNGDRFYSCLVSGGGNGAMTFSTHKYIEGFYIVKNLEQDNFAFNVTFDATGVNGIECYRYKSGVSAEGQIYTPDAITLLPGDGVWYEVSGTFSVAELQGYYDAMDAQNGGLS